MTTRRGLTVAGVVILILAGCAQGPVSPTPTRLPGYTPTETAASPTASPTDTPTEHPTATPYQNPWHQQEIVIAVNDSAVVGERIVLPVVQEAIDYWEGPGRQYRPYDVDLTLDADAESPDVIVEFQPDVVCEGDRGPIGCAPLVRADDYVAERPQLVTIETGFINSTTLQVIKHEIGHLLGLEHGDEPEEIMAARVESVRRSTPNATERLNPWRNETLQVYVQEDGLGVGGYANIRRGEIDDAFSFYETDRDDGWISNVQFEYTDSRETADIVVNASTDRPCDAPSCGWIFGQNVDNDPALEYYTYARVTVYTGVDDTDWSWHVAYWLGFALGAEEVDDLPDDLQDADRGGNWWDD